MTGVTDLQEAQASLEFAKRFELIKGQETKNIKLQGVDLSDESAIASALPRYSACESCQELCMFQISACHLLTSLHAVRKR